MKIIEYREGQEAPGGVLPATEGRAAHAVTPLGWVALQDRDLLIYDDLGRPSVARWQRPEQIERTTSRKIGSGGITTTETWVRQGDGWICTAPGPGFTTRQRGPADAPWPTLPAQACANLPGACNAADITERVVAELRHAAQRQRPFSPSHSDKEQNHDQAKQERPD